MEYAFFLHVFCVGVVEPVEVVDNGDRTHTVSYVPTKEGPYSINVLYADEEIPRRYVTVISVLKLYSTLYSDLLSHILTGWKRLLGFLSLLQTLQTDTC